MNGFLVLYNQETKTWKPDLQLVKGKLKKIGIRNAAFGFIKIFLFNLYKTSKT